MSSSPAIIRSAVVLPQPDGPDEHEQLGLRDLERQVLDCHEPVREALAELVEPMSAIVPP